MCNSKLREAVAAAQHRLRSSLATGAKSGRTEALWHNNSVGGQRPFPRWWPVVSDSISDVFAEHYLPSLERRIMKKLNKVASLVAMAALASTVTAVSAQSVDNWVSGTGLPWKNGTNELCWRNNEWTPATGLAGCDGVPAPAPAPAPMAAAAPAMTPPPAAAHAAAPVVVAAPTSEKVTFAADAFFDFDKSTLKPEGKAKLDDLVGKMGGLN